MMRFSVWFAAAATALALAACSNKKQPDQVVAPAPTKIKVDQLIFEPKVGAPGDTVTFTAVITSSSQNVGDYPSMEWKATGGSFVDSTTETVHWVSPHTTGIFKITAKATNNAGSASNTAAVFIGAGETLVDFGAGQITLIGSGPDFHFLHTFDVTKGSDVYVYDYASRTSSDAVAPLLANNLNVAYSPDGMLEAHAADTTAIGATVRPRNIYIGDFTTGMLKRITKDGTRPGNPEHNQYNYPSFSPNGQVIAFQRLAQSWDNVATDSFHVYIQDLVTNKRTLVTYDYDYPRGFFPTFSTDSKWLVYVLDKQRTGQWDMFASPMTGNDVDGSQAAAKRLTNDGAIVVGGPRDIKKPPMGWNPMSPTLAVATPDKVYVIQMTSSGGTATPVALAKTAEVVWAGDGSLLAVSYFKTVDESTFSTIATVTPAGVATDRVTALAGDNLRDMVFSPDGKWLLYRTIRGGVSWFNVADISAGVLTAPVPLTPTAAAGASGTAYRSAMSLRPAWTSTNLMIYPAFESTVGTPGLFTRDLSGLVN
ncbi:MAG TPA: hypothetical protein VFH88_07275 [Candidatus Krumholzibacteria bacterium]|nr:hypothetical protein [Candidatus Krumholzibacteria bacterium]